jgi:flagellar protein FlgJ
MDRKAMLILTGLGLLALAMLTKGKAVVRRVSMGRVNDFVAKNRAAAEAVGKEFNLPAWLILTQGGHESAWGLSGLTAKANNLFGFTGEAWAKQGKSVVNMPTREFLNGVWVALTRPFRAYPSVSDSMRDYARLLTTQPRYSSTVSSARANDPAGTWGALGRSGYATDPTYGEKLAGVYQLVKQSLV